MYLLIGISCFFCGFSAKNGEIKYLLSQKPPSFTFWMRFRFKLYKSISNIVICTWRVKWMGEVFFKLIKTYKTSQHAKWSKPAWLVGQQEDFNDWFFTFSEWLYTVQMSYMSGMISKKSLYYNVFSAQLLCPAREGG